MTERKNDTFEIDLGKLFFLYLRKWWLIVLCALVGGGGMFIYTSQYVTPLYQTGVTIYVNNVRSGQQIDYISGSNLSTSQQLVSTYINIIRSDTVLEKVAASTGLDISSDYIRSIMSAAQVGETELFEVYISHPDPEMAAFIANTIAEVAPGEIENFVVGSSTKVIDYAKVPAAPYSPSYRKNVLLGAGVGVLLILVVLTILDLLDVRIKQEEDLMDLCEVPVLGRIPVFTQSKSQKRRSIYQSIQPSEEQN